MEQETVTPKPRKSAEQKFKAGIELISEALRIRLKERSNAHQFDEAKNVKALLTELGKADFQSASLMSELFREFEPATTTIAEVGFEEGGEK